MSLILHQVNYYPGKERKLVGRNKPGVVHIIDVQDKYMWIRRKVSKELNIPEEELADEPDEMLDHSDDQDWFDFNS